MNIRIFLGFTFFLILSCGDGSDDSDSNIAPTVEIIMPEADITVIKGDELFISVEASDSDGQIDTIYIEFDGENIAQITTLPYEFTFNTYAENIGVYELKAIASDNEGKLTTSNTILVSIEEIELIPPQVALLPETFTGMFNIHLGAQILDRGNVSSWKIGVCWNTTGEPVKDENANNFVGVYPSLDMDVFQFKTGVLESNTTYYFRAYMIGSLGIVYSENEMQIETASDFYSNTGTFIDSRDNQEYSWVTINEQTWMAENLRYTNNADFCIEYYDDNQDILDYGNVYRLCDVCPEGWRLPFKEDYQMLVDYVGGSTFAGKYLKSDNVLFWDSQYANNATFFNALPGGYKLLPDLDVLELNVGEAAYFRFDDGEGNDNPTFLKFYQDSNRAQFEYIDSAAGVLWHSLRCIKIE